jgi:hypothetical protein
MADRRKPYKKRPRRTPFIHLTISSQNGSTLPDAFVQRVQDLILAEAIKSNVYVLFHEYHGGSSAQNH